ncbi:MAG: NAD(P)/FAD-dependent oxidoreductase [Bacteroidia bacterium]|nr:NAD(P)/FAD-dependent oxidoreductase [Bacteroidia bacterium]
MKEKMQYDVIIVGGSFAGLAAAMALGRALRKVLVIDSGLPCNRQTPQSHNFLTNDGMAPSDISSRARKEVEKYPGVQFLHGQATQAHPNSQGFEIGTHTGAVYHAKKVLFATGIRDLMPDMDGFAECWGKSVLHCPYCHGYEVRNEKTGVLINSVQELEFVKLLTNWTTDLRLFTHAAFTLSDEQMAILKQRKVEVVQEEMEKLLHTHGQLEEVLMKDQRRYPLRVLYAPRPFEQHCDLPRLLGCEFTDEGYLKTDALQRSSVKGIYACGDNSSRMRTVANAVATGTTAGMMLNKELVLEEF